MNLKSLLRTGSAAAIAAVLSFGALPTMAHAKDVNGRERQARSVDDTRSNQSRAQAVQARQQQRAERQAPRQQQRAERAPQQQQQQRSYQAPVRQERAAQAVERSGRTWNQSERRSATGAERSGREWNRSGGDSARVQAQAQAQAQARSRTYDRSGSRDWSSRRSSDNSARTTSDNWQRNRTYSDNTRSQSYRGDRQQTQNAYRSGYRDGNRTSNYRDGDRRSWSRDWRRDNRYNWSSYRNSNRDIYRLGRYYSPYSNYRYSRLSIGFTLNSLFFGSRYWINDPWQYRLPEAYGSYRWVRYYDDALLVDTYSGQVVDVIHDFFW